MYSILTTSVYIIVFNIDSKLQLRTESDLKLELDLIRSYKWCWFYKLINVSNYFKFTSFLLLILSKSEKLYNWKKFVIYTLTRENCTPWNYLEFFINIILFFYNLKKFDFQLCCSSFVFTVSGYLKSNFIFNRTIIFLWLNKLNIA